MGRKTERRNPSFNAGRATSLRMGKTRVEKLARESSLLIGPSVTSYRPISAEKNEATVENGSTNGDDSWNANSLYIKMASTRPDNAEEGEAEEEEEEEIQLRRGTRRREKEKERKNKITN